MVAPGLGWRIRGLGGFVCSSAFRRSWGRPRSGKEPRKRGTTNKGAASLTLGFFWVPVGLNGREIAMISPGGEGARQGRPAHSGSPPGWCGIGGLRGDAADRGGEGAVGGGLGG